MAARGKSFRHGSQCEGAWIALGDFVPLEWRRDARVRRWPNGVGRGDRPILRILVVIDEHAVPLFFPPLARGELGRASLDITREGKRCATHLLEGPSLRHAYVDVHPA